MEGQDGSFAAIDDATNLAWADDLRYSMDVIDDLVNVGLNYIVTIGDVTTFPKRFGNNFTIRITPVQEDPQTPPPAYV
ncbi:MAG: hypothetical protein PVG22_11565 [Chromatiales bacterium]|jgi:hypothetical protein